MNVHSPVFIPNLIGCNIPTNRLVWRTDNCGAVVSNTPIPIIVSGLVQRQQQQQQSAIQIQQLTPHAQQLPSPCLQQKYIVSNQMNYQNVNESVYYTQTRTNNNLLLSDFMKNQLEHESQQYQQPTLEHCTIEKDFVSSKTENIESKCQDTLNLNIETNKIVGEVKVAKKLIENDENLMGDQNEFWQLPLKEQVLHQLNVQMVQKRNQKEEMYQSLQEQFWQQLMNQCDYDDTVQHNSSKIVTKTNNDIPIINQKHTTTSTSKTNKNSGGRNDKRTNYKNNNNKTGHHHSHPWLASNLKGHTDEIRDIDFSSNGKYLASCAEDNSNNTTNTTDNQHHDNQQRIIRNHLHRNNVHRNSTTSTSSSSSTDSTAGSGTDDINCSSSNEDISIHIYHQTKQTINQKKSSKNGRNRQRQRQRQLKVINCTNIQQTTTSSSTTMEIDDELKENLNPLQANKILSSTVTTATRKQYKNSSIISSSSSSATTTTTTTASSSSILPLKSVVNISKQQQQHFHHLSKAGGSISSAEIEEIVNMQRTIIPSSSTSSVTSSSSLSALQLNLNESDLLKFLRYYVIDPNLLRIYGYPVESTYHDGSIEIFKCLPRPFTHYKTNGKFKRCRNKNINNNNTLTNTTIGNIINENDGLSWTSRNLLKSSSSSSSSSSSDSSMQISSNDSGQGDSGSSSPPFIDSDTSETGEEETTTIFYTPDGNYQIFNNYNQFGEKQCVRCNRNFILSENGEYVTKEECNYHWGRPYQVYISGKGITNFVNCCNREQSSFGCCNNYVHVWTGIDVGINGPFNDYIQTTKNYLNHKHSTLKNLDNLRKNKVYAVDCEMCFTAMGLDVGKITVIGIDGKLAYEKYIRPDMEIVDYNTRFSGINEYDLSANNPNVKTLKEVQNELLQFINTDTILIGHALDNDLRALKILHKNVIDTSITFPHMNGFPYRRALKHLTKNCLGRDIQTGENGHCSFEDSQACLELILWRVQKDFELASE